MVKSKIKSNQYNLSFEKQDTKNESHLIEKPEYIKSKALDTKNDTTETKESTKELLSSVYNYCIGLESALLLKYEFIKAGTAEVNEKFLNEYISKIKDYLINLQNDKNIDFDDDKYSYIFKKLYEIIYCLINFEIILTGKSTLYDFINDKHIDTRYINSIIMNKINNLNACSNLDEKRLKLLKKINLIIKKETEKGKNIDYFNINILKVLVMLETNYDLYQDLLNEFNSVYEECDDCDYYIDRNANKYRSDLKLLFDHKSEHNYYTKALINRIISLIISASIFITGGIAVTKSAKKTSIANSFEKETSITSLSTGETVKSEEEYLGFDDFYPNETYVNVIGQWQNDSEENTISRSVKEYDVSYSDLSEFENLDSIDLDKLGIEPNCYSETLSGKDMLNADKYNGYQKEVKHVNYHYNGKKLHKVAYYNTLTIYYILYILLMSLIELFGIHIIYKDNFLKQIVYMFNESKYQKDQANERVENDLDTIASYLNDNKEVREKFNELYQENIELLYDEDELKNRIESMFNKIDESQEKASLILSRNQN